MDELWVCKDFTAREQRQVRTSNVLLICGIAFATLASMHGLDMWLGHPDFVERHTIVGGALIWLIEQMRRISVLPTSTMHHVKHSHHGGITVKPFLFLAIRMRTLG